MQWGTTEGADEKWVYITPVPWEYLITFFLPLMCYIYVGERGQLNTPPSNAIIVESVHWPYMTLICPIYAKNMKKYSMRRKLPYETHIAYTL